MLSYVYRQLTFDLPRTVLMVATVASVVSVILVLEGFYSGLLTQMRQAVLARGADLIVTQAGIANLTAARSVLPQVSRGDVEAIDGVAGAHPLTGLPIIYERGDLRTPAFLLVYDTGGGPTRFAQGRAPEQQREIAIDRSLALKYDLKPGDAFVISNFEFRVSGLTEGAAAIFTPMAFARYDDLIDFYFESDLAADISTFPLVSFLLVELAPKADRVAVMAEIEARVPAADVFTSQALAENDEALGRVFFGPLMVVLVGAAYVAGILVIGIIMFSAVNNRRHELGVLKALGFGDGFLRRAVVSESLVITLLGIPAGVVLAVGIAEAIEATMPLYLIGATDPLPLLRTVIGCSAVAILGALGPVRMIRGVDPARVFGS